ncbi:hypothetical protein SDC9_103987 [bioreactor metagenome]|uniref:Uncharacterized protein n=1 Tax=bioreactor metagenome TaxID=1076179 RepID=A0A645AWI9_9ZZZZ
MNPAQHIPVNRLFRAQIESAGIDNPDHAFAGRRFGNDFDSAAAAARQQQSGLFEHLQRRQNGLTADIVFQRQNPGRRNPISEAAFQNPPFHIRRNFPIFRFTHRLSSRNRSWYGKSILKKCKKTRASLE